MTEREILFAALDRVDSVERATYLDQACAGDVTVTVIRIAPPRVPGHCSFTLTPKGRHLAVTHPNGTIYVVRLAPLGQVFRLP